MFKLKRAGNGVWYGTFSFFDNLNVKHGFSSRLGGVSKAPYNSLNLGLKTGDQLENAIENRRLFCQAVDVPFSSLVTAEQVHGTTIKVVRNNDGGNGADQSRTAIPETDALITDEPGLPLMLFFADCVPVMIYDKSKKIVAVSHAGWKGTVGKIAQKTILAMQHNLGSRSEDCLVGIGPSIGPKVYEVDEVVISALRQSFSWWEKVVMPHGDNHWLLDLWQTNKLQLIDIGVKEDNIEVSGICTISNTELFYSHRAGQGITGRMGAVIML